MKYISTVKELAVYRFFKSVVKDLKNKEKNTYPSLKLGKKIGLDIHTEWDIPKPFKEDDINTFITIPYTDAGKKLGISTEQYNDIINFIYDRIVEINPHLSRIDIKEKDDKFDVIFGAISKYNFDDIYMFTTLSAKEKELGKTRHAILKNNIYYSEKTDKLKKLYGKYPGYTMSTTTLENVLEYLRRVKNINI